MKYKSLLFLALISTFSYEQVNYLNFDGTNDFMEIQHHVDLNFEGDFTVEMKFKRERDGIREDLMDKKKIAGGTSSFNDLAITLNSSDRIVLWFKESDMNLVLLTSSTIVEVGEWYHVASVREGSTVRLYVNGVLESTASFYGNLVSNGPMRIGSNRTINSDPNSAPIFPFDGGIDEIRIWNYARTGAEINEYSDEELIGGEAGLVRYCNLNQGVPCEDNPDETFAVDSASDINGELINFSLSGGVVDPCTSNWVGRKNEQNGIDEDLTVLVSCYPNPTSGRLVLIFERESQLKDLLFFDIAGKLVFTYPVNSSVSELDIDIRSLANGKYLLFTSIGDRSYFLTQIQKL